MDLPTGTLTFLFTDIEGSMRLWEEHPEAMRDALARHEEIVRGALEARVAGKAIRGGGPTCRAWRPIRRRQAHSTPA